MAWSQVVNGLGVATVVLALLWQLQQTGVLQSLLGGAGSKGAGAPDGDSKRPAMNTAKLLSDLKDADKQHTALSSCYAFAGNSEYALQLARAGVHKELLQLALHAGLADVKDERLPIALMTLGRIVNGVDGVSTDLMAHADKGLVSKAVQVIRTGVPGWIAAVAQLVHALCRVDASACTTLQSKVLSGQEDVLVPAAVGLLEMGGVAKHQDVLISGCRLAELLVAASGQARQQLLDRNAVRLLVQVLTDDRQGSQVVGAAAQALAALVERHKPALEQLGKQGAVQPLVAEMRKPSKHSLGPALALLASLVEDNDARQDMISSGLLSVCGQMLFQGGEEAGALRGRCVAVLCGLAGEAPAEGSAGLHVGLAAQQKAGVACMMAMLTQDRSMPLHGAAVDAMRDMGGSSDACAELVAQGVLEHLAQVLSSKLDVADGGVQGWLMQAQRSAAVLVAMVALQPELRPLVVEAGVVEALHTAIQNHLHGPALRQQLRVTAAAALVPILSTTDDKYDLRVMESGVLEPLATMFTRTNDQERQVAAKVLGMLRRNSFFAQVFEAAKIDLDAV